MQQRNRERTENFLPAFCLYGWSNQLASFYTISFFCYLYPLITLADLPERCYS